MTGFTPAPAARVVPTPVPTLALPRLRLLSLAVELEALEPLHFEALSGGTLRGAVGRALAERVCPLPELRCRECELIEDCAFGSLFETPDHLLSVRSPGFRTPPHPLWMRWSRHPGRLVDAGRRLTIEVHALPVARRHLADLLGAIESAARRGLGPRRARGRVVAIRDLSDPGARRVDPRAPLPLPTVPAACLEPGPPLRKVEVHTVTPLRLHRRGRLLRSPDPVDLLVAIVRRARHLAEFYGDPGSVPPADDGWLEGARSLRGAWSVRLETRHRRHSSRSGRQRFEGVLGRMRIQGELGPFLPALRLGEILGAGKGIALGFGHYRLVRCAEGERAG